MEHSIIPVTAPVVSGLAIPMVKTTDTGRDLSEQSAAASDAVVISPQAQQQAQEQITSAREAALSFKDVYAVSDKEFSIFKDANGTYITRYVSLRDGTVTYSPTAPAVVKSSSSDTPTVAINA